MHNLAQATVMNFLNEIAAAFPSAISLAAGRPTDKFFEQLHPDVLLSAMNRYELHAGAGNDGSTARAQFLQYGRTAGMINELVAAQLRADERVPAAAERLLITSGCQEALALCLSALCRDEVDVLLVCNPTYIGATGAAQAMGISVSALASSSQDIGLAQRIEQSAVKLQREGRKARVLYLIPDFDNPTGRVIDEVERKAILAVCSRHRIVVLEDNPYGMFRYNGEDLRPMAALDEVGCVIYLSTFSKKLCPALRVGAASLPETLFGDRSASNALWEELVQRKSFLTVNTSQINQAIVGGILLEQNGSLRNWIQPALDWYRNNRDTMLNQLHDAFSPLSHQIRWNRPDGGFFLSMDLPFRFNIEAVNECATNYGVIVMPLAFFALDSSQDRRIRLAFSSADPVRICKGVAALSRFVMKRMDDPVRWREGEGHP